MIKTIKTAIGFLVWLMLRAYVIVTRKPSVTFHTPNGQPYLTRWPLRTDKPWPDAEGRTAGVGWYLHRIVRSDHERELHNHPAPGFALVLRGGYTEWRMHDPRRLRGLTLPEVLRPRGLRVCGDPTWRGLLSANLLTHLDFHRVVLPQIVHEVSGVALCIHERPSWSLFYFGPRHENGWGFLRDDGTIRRAPHNDGNDGSRRARDDEAVTL